MVVKCRAEYVIPNPRPRAGRRLALLYLGWCRCPLSQRSDQSGGTGSVGNLPLPPPPTWLPLWSRCRPPRRRDTHLRETDGQTDRRQMVGIGNNRKKKQHFFEQTNQSPVILMNDGPVVACMTLYTPDADLFGTITRLF